MPRERDWQDRVVDRFLANRIGTLLEDEFEGLAQMKNIMELNELDFESVKVVLRKRLKSLARSAQLPERIVDWRGAIEGKTK